MPPVKRSKFFLVFGSAWVLFGLPFFFIGNNMREMNAKYEAEGKRVTGTVSNLRANTKYHSKETRTETSYYVSYRFLTTGGTRVEHETSMGSTEFEKLSKDGPIDIEYLPSDPQSSRPVGNNQSSGAYIFMGVGASLSLLGLVIIGWDLKARRG